MKNVKKIIIYSCFIVLVSLFICTTVYYRNKYRSTVQSYIQQSELVRERAKQYEQLYKRAATTNTELRFVITRAADTNTELGNSLQRSVTTVAELREQLETIRTKYQEMENLFNSVRDYYDYTDSNNSNIYNNEVK